MKRPVWVTVVLLVIGAAAYLLRGQNAPPLARPEKSGGTATVERPRVESAASKTAEKAPQKPTAGTTTAAAGGKSLGDGGIPRLFARRASDEWVEAEGRVVKVLPDDDSTDGGTNARHERLLVKITPDVTILIAHNIDAAPRVPAEEGDTLRFRGQYEWSEKGGTVHFTHAPKFKTQDPNARGWIEHARKRYE
jgi:hypothetical protein